MTSKTIYPASLLCDFYKVSHREQYPVGTQRVYSTWTPRTSRVEGIDSVVAFGFQGFVQEYLIDYFNEHFFSRPKVEVVAEYIRYMNYALFNPNPDFQHIADLHDLGYLPVLIKAVPEGTSVPIRVPMLTIENTDDRFFWVTNYLETLISCSIWQPSTSATVAKEYRKILDKWADKTASDPSFVQFQGHDFSMRGMGGLDAAHTSGAGHLLSFVGTDTIPAIAYLEAYYGADIEKGLVGCSVPATEHSVMCAGGADDEFETYKRLITEIYPTGIVSIVSDTWDLWHVLTDTIPRLKDVILDRAGRVVIRPDSGDPVEIICGQQLNDYSHLESLEDAVEWEADRVENKIAVDTPHGEHGESTVLSTFTYKGKYYEVVIDFSWNRYDKRFYYLDGTETSAPKEVQPYPAQKGVIELLWDTFGGTVNDKGYKELNPAVGAIYGDAITLARADQICSRLAAKGFASTNIVFGIGSYTYQYNTRDTFGFALKSTHCVINGVEHNIFKDPVTDNGVKKSQTGRVCVVDGDYGKLAYVDGLTIAGAAEGFKFSPDYLQPIFKDGKALNIQTLAAIRARVLGANYA